MYHKNVLTVINTFNSDRLRRKVNNRHGVLFIIYSRYCQNTVITTLPLLNVCNNILSVYSNLLLLSIYNQLSLSYLSLLPLSYLSRHNCCLIFSTTNTQLAKLAAKHQLCLKSQTETITCQN